jgi:hypothetical protein
MSSAILGRPKYEAPSQGCPMNEKGFDEELQRPVFNLGFGNR